MNEEEFENRLRKPAPWVVKMIDYYNEHGFYRAEDLRRLLGDPCRGVEASPRRGDAIKRVLDAA